VEEGIVNNVEELFKKCELNIEEEVAKQLRYQTREFIKSHLNIRNISVDIEITGNFEELEKNIKQNILDYLEGKYYRNLYTLKKEFLKLIQNLKHDVIQQTNQVAKTIILAQNKGFEIQTSHDHFSLIYPGKIHVTKVIRDGKTYNLPEKLSQQLWVENLIVKVFALNYFVISGITNQGGHPHFTAGEMCKGELNNVNDFLLTFPTVLQTANLNSAYDFELKSEIIAYINSIEGKTIIW